MLAALPDPPAATGCAPWRVRSTVSTNTIGWLGRPAVRDTATHWARHNSSICVADRNKEASVRGQCALPQSGAILGCLQLLHECRAAVCVPGFTVGADGSARRAPGCITRSHTRADRRHPMCKSGCLLLTLEPAAAGFGRALPPPLRRACAKSWRSVVAGNATGAAWYDGMAAAATRALPLDDVEGGEARDVLLLFGAPRERWSG